MRRDGRREPVDVMRWRSAPLPLRHAPGAWARGRRRGHRTRRAWYPRGPMFAPSQEQVRRFFCSAWAKSRAGQPMEAIETLAAGWVAEHPEFLPYANQELLVTDGTTAGPTASCGGARRSRCRNGSTTSCGCWPGTRGNACPMKRSTGTCGVISWWSPTSCTIPKRGCCAACGMPWPIRRPPSCGPCLNGDSCWTCPPNRWLYSPDGSAAQRITSDNSRSTATPAAVSPISPGG